MANGTKLEFDMESISKLSQAMKNKETEMLVAAKVVLNTLCGTIQAYAQRNASWEDQTGNARQGLTCKPKITKTQLQIILYHKMEYGYWLELAHQRRYKILEESLQAHVGEFIESIKELIK